MNTELRTQAQKEFNKYLGKKLSTSLENSLDTFSNDFLSFKNLEEEYYENIYYAKFIELCEALKEGNLKERKQRAVGGRAGLTGAATKPARSQGCSSRDRGSRKPDVFSPEERPREFFHGPPRGCGTRLGRVH